MRLSLRPYQAAAPTLVIKPPSPVSPLFHHHAVGPCQASSRSEFAPIAARLRTPMLMLLKEDAFALFSCTIYHRCRLIVLLNLSARRY
jgi:hypothetical protein